MRRVREITISLLQAIRTEKKLQAWKEGKNNYTDRQLAKELHMTTTTLSRLSTGVVTPKSETYVKITLLAQQTIGNERTFEITQHAVGV